MKIDKLPTGTKLIWDVKTELFNAEIGKNEYVHYYYPCTVGEQDRSRQRHRTMIYSPSNRNWMSPEQEYLRLPTEEELTSLQWPDI